jgi:DNA invertase Pin-like site-specific DNA recombinase
MPIAYSYMRFSSGKQAKEHSIERQRQMAEDYISENPQLGLELDTSLNLTDKALSAFSGKNMTDGNLGKFFDLVYNGEIEVGSYLLIENLDRFSRDVAWKATHDLTTLVKGGIVVVVLSDRQVYSEETLSSEGGSFKLMQSVIGFMRANEESEQKSVRVGKAWRQKMLRVADGVQLTKRVPFWINKEDRTKTIPEKVKIVKRIFELSSKGLGGQRIAGQLNEEGVETPTRMSSKWAISSVKKVLNSEAVIGVLNTADGVKHQGYYPRVISDKLWAKTRFMGETSKGVRDNKEVHPLSGLCYCRACGARAQRSGKTGRVRQDGTKNVWRTLVCANSMGGRSNCAYQSISYDKIVNAVLTALMGYQYVPPKDDVGGELWQLDQERGFLVDDARDMDDAIKANRGNIEARKRLAELLNEMSVIDDKMAKLEELGRPLNATLVEGAIMALLRDDLIDNQRFRQAIARVNIDFNSRTLEVIGHEGTVLEARIE